jgi:hypothetical protein
MAQRREDQGVPNTPMESFFKTLKVERTDLSKIPVLVIPTSAASSQSAAAPE